MTHDAGDPSYAACDGSKATSSQTRHVPSGVPCIVDEHENPEQVSGEPQPWVILPMPMYAPDETFRASVQTVSGASNSDVEPTELVSWSSSTLWVPSEGDVTPSSKNRTGSRTAFRSRCAESTGRSSVRKTQVREVRDATEQIIDLTDGGGGGGGGVSDQRARYTCKECSKTFATESGLSDHACSTGAETCGVNTSQNKCSTCSKVFRSSYRRKVHQEIFHPELRRFRCGSCLLQFASLFALQQHKLRRCARGAKRKKPSTEKPATKKPAAGVEASGQKLKSRMTWKCDTCHITVSSSCSLRRHREIHNANRQKHECGKCHKLFTRKDAVTTHQRINPHCNISARKA